jgi:copper chaperone
MEEKTVKIPKMSCQHCAGTIQREVGELDGAPSVVVNVGAKTATFQWQAPASWETISGLLNEIGFPAEEQEPRMDANES